MSPLSQPDLFSYFFLSPSSLLSFPGGSDDKASVYNAGDRGSIPGSGRSPGEGNGKPVFLPGESHGWRSLVGYSPRGRKESDTTERLHLKAESISFLVCLCVWLMLIQTMKLNFQNIRGSILLTTLPFPAPNVSIIMENFIF